MSYILDMLEKRQRCQQRHIDMLRAWTEPLPAVVMATVALPADLEDKDKLVTLELSNGGESRASDMLNMTQLTALTELLQTSTALFISTPGRRTVIRHKTDTGTLAPTHITLDPYTGGGGEGV